MNTSAGVVVFARTMVVKFGLDTSTVLGKPEMLTVTAHELPVMLRNRNEYWKRSPKLRWEMSRISTWPWHTRRWGWLCAGA
jgi:hypothetical protein